MEWKNYEHARDNFPIYDVRNQFIRYIYNRSSAVFRANEAKLDAVKTWAEVEKRQENIAKDFIRSIGGLPSMDTPLNPQIVGTIQCDGFRIEKIIFEARPKTYVTANMYIPDNLTGPAGAVLFVCGHHEQAKQAEEYQVVCRYFVKAGLVVFIVDPVGQGERLSYYDPAAKETTVRWGSGEHEHVGSQCYPLGDCIAKYFMHDISRSIDYLCTRPEVNPEKIGITGNSGGGTQSSMAMLCDRRLAAAAPGTYITNREELMFSGIADDAEQCWPGNTSDGYDQVDILLAMAPKPVMVLAVAYDFFPIEGTVKTVETVKRFWEMKGKPNNLQLYVENTGHNYTRKMAAHTAEFFSEHLNGKKITPDSTGTEPIDPKLLWCTTGGQIRIDLPEGKFVFEENQGRERNKMSSLKWLKSKVVDCRIPCNLFIRNLSNNIDGEYSVLKNFWIPQANLFNHAYTFRLKEYAEKSLPVTIALWDGGTAKIGSHSEFIESECAKGRAVMVLDVSGVGTMVPYQINNYDPLVTFGTMMMMAHDLIWLDDSLPAIRTYDVIRAVDALHDNWEYVDTNDINLYLHGKYGYYGHLAAMLDGRIKGVEAEKTFEELNDWIFTRHYEDRDIYSIIFPGILGGN